VNNIKIDLREIGWDGMDWIYVAQDMDQWRALVKTVMNVPFPYNAQKFFFFFFLKLSPITTRNFWDFM
jgi:hypothetical protein